MKKLLSLMVSLAMTASLAVAPLSVAHAEETGVKAYVDDRTGVVSSYEGNYSGHNSTTNESAFKWGNFSGNWESTVSNNPETGLETIVFPGENSKADSASLVLSKAFAATSVKKVVMAVRANGTDASLPWQMYYLSGTKIGSTWGAANGTDAGVLSFNGDNKFREYEFSTASGFNTWTGDKQALRMTMKATTFPVTLDIAYIRFVDDTYGQEIEISNGSGGNDHLKDIVRFEFLKDLDPSTVKAENIQLNGAPATYIIENKATDLANSLRVRLGSLAEASRYTVTFDGVKYADGTAVEEVFKFATENESIPVYPESLKAYNTANDGIIASWEATRTGEYRMGNGNWTGAVCEYDAVSGVDKVSFASETNPHAFFKLASAIEGAENISKMVVGVKTNQDVDLSLFYVAGTQLKGFNEDQVAKFIQAKKGDGGYSEYSVPISSFVGLADGMQSFRLSVSGAEESPAVDYTEGLKLEIAYVRFVTNEYQARTSEIANFAKDYSILTDSVRFLFPKNLDAETVKAENILINGKACADVFNVKDNTVSVRFGVLNSMTRYKVTFPGMKYEDGADVNEEFVFTTTGVGTVEGDTKALFKTYELIKDFETANETVVDAENVSGTITAVIGGLYGVSDTEKDYSMYIAVYDGETLVGAESTPITLAPNEEKGQQTVEITVPEEAPAVNYNVKAFLWETDTQVPCIAPVTP